MACTPVEGQRLRSVELVARDLRARVLAVLPPEGFFLAADGDLPRVLLPPRAERLAVDCEALARLVFRRPVLRFFCLPVLTSGHMPVSCGRGSPAGISVPRPITIWSGDLAGFRFRVRPVVFWPRGMAFS